MLRRWRSGSPSLASMRATSRDRRGRVGQETPRPCPVRPGGRARRSRRDRAGARHGGTPQTSTMKPSKDFRQGPDAGQRNGVRSHAMWMPRPAGKKESAPDLPGHRTVLYIRCHASGSPRTCPAQSSGSRASTTRSATSSRNSPSSATGCSATNISSDLGKGLGGLDEAEKVDDRLVPGCQSRVWFYADRERAPGSASGPTATQSSSGG